MGRQAILMERTDQYNLYLMKPNYTPPVKRDESESFWSRISKEKPPVPSGGSASSLGKLTQEEKTALRYWLEKDGGKVSEEHWDNFLADLVDVGLISNEERRLTNGSLLTLDANALKHMSFSEFNQMQDVWTGNPLDWLEQMSFYCSMGIRYAELDNSASSGVISHKAACDKVLRLTREIWYS